MKAVILRRRKLGRTSCKEIARLSKTGIVAVRNDQPFPEGAELVIRWGTTSNLPYKAQVLNEAAAIHWVADKSASRKIMADAGLSPTTWLFWEDWADDERDITNVIIRKRTHSQGKDLYHCNSLGEVSAAVKLLGPGNYYISEYIDKVAEYRVCVVSGRVAWIAKKTPADEKAIAWNVAQGGRFDNVRWDDWPLEAVRVALEAFQLSGLDFGGVDVMVDDNGKAYVLEINSAPSLTSPYRQECMAKTFDYIVEHGKAQIEPNWRTIEGNARQITNYLNAIHPALTEKARVQGQ